MSASYAIEYNLQLVKEVELEEGEGYFQIQNIASHVFDATGDA